MIALGCDHGGYALMCEVRKFLTEQGLAYKDYGTNSADSCDYPEFAERVSRAVSGGECRLGILICSTGIGMSMAANRIKGIRAALCSDCFSAEMTRRHNDANILVLGALVTGGGLALKITEVFLKSDFDGGRHQRRVDMLNTLV